MPIQQATPYLMFNGTGAKAVALYERALGATVNSLQRFGDVDESCGEADKDRVMHAHLTLGGAMLMLSDGPGDQPVPSESNVHVALEFDDPADLQTKFDALAETGEVTMPVQDTFWGAKFGMLKDEFGIHWMFNHTKKEG